MIGVSRKFTPRDLDPWFFWDNNFKTLLNSTSKDLTKKRNIETNITPGINSIDYHHVVNIVPGNNKFFNIIGTSEIETFLRGSWTLHYKVVLNSDLVTFLMWGAAEYGDPVSGNGCFWWWKGTNGDFRVIGSSTSSFTGDGAKTTHIPVVGQEYQITIIREDPNITIYIDNIQKSITWQNQAAFNSFLNSITLVNGSELGIINRAFSDIQTVNLDGKMFGSVFFDRAITDNERDLLYTYYL